MSSRATATTDGCEVSIGGFSQNNGHITTLCIHFCITSIFSVVMSLQWRHNECDSVSKHRRRDCLLSRLFRRRSKKTWKLCVTGLCAGNSMVAGEVPAWRASNAEIVSIYWPHHGVTRCVIPSFQGYACRKMYERSKAAIFTEFFTVIWHHEAVFVLSHHYMTMKRSIDGKSGIAHIPRRWMKSEVSKCENEILKSQIGRSVTAPSSGAHFTNGFPSQQFKFDDEFVLL